MKKLIDALRSGEFKQTTGALRRKECFCALGVACEVFRRETGRGEWKDRGFLLERSWSTVSPPKEVTEYFGMTNPLVSSIACDNDNGATFEEIAYRLEKHL